MSEPADVSGLLTVEQAIAIIDAAAVTPRVIEVPLSSADGLVLAQDLVADRDYPPFDKSLMDGYAVRCADVAAVPVELQVVAESAAGAPAARGFEAGQTIAIMTGAPMPMGADGVVPVEDVEKLPPSPRTRGEGGGEGRAALGEDRREQSVDAHRPSPQPSPRSTGEREFVRILHAPVPDRFIARRGSDMRDGEIVLHRGVRIGPTQLAVAGSVGAANIAAFAKPRAAVLATGDELVDVAKTPGESQIRNSNSVMLVSLLRRLGCDVTDLGIVRDDPKLVRDALTKGMQFDLLFVSGGMSMGAYDFVPRTLIELGLELKITKLRIKPGKPFVFASHKTGYVFGLPGNPVSGFVCTVRLASRLAQRMAGATPRERWLEGELTRGLGANGPREFYQPANFDNGVVDPLEWRGSADVFTLARANALLVRGENEPALSPGARVRVLEI